MFVDVVDITYIYRILAEYCSDGKFPLGKQVVFRMFRTFARQNKIRALELGDAYDLPGVLGGIIQQANRYLC
jgi:hypothetical protein